jgi:hypothetical protein
MRRVRKMVVPILPTSREDEAIVERLIRRKRAAEPRTFTPRRVLGRTVFSKEDSERLIRIEQMLIELLKQSES